MTTSSHRLPSYSALLFVAGLIAATASLHATEIDPNTSPSTFVDEGYAQMEAGQTDIALEAFQAALESNRDDLSARLGQAMVFAHLERHQEAFVSYDAIIQRFPRHAFAWNGRGLAAFNMEDFDEALKSFEQATADQPVNGFFYEALAWTRMCRGEFAQAAESAKLATLMYNRKGETSVYPLLIAYFSYLESKDTLNAQRALNYAVKNKPGDQWPAPVIDYLTGTNTIPQLISFVSNGTEETEAHTYIGLSLRLQGDTETSAQHLAWVNKYGDSQVFEYTLARALSLQNSVASVVR
jgi:tetratricopeptide (TPR) repeat protein